MNSPVGIEAVSDFVSAGSIRMLKFSAPVKIYDDESITGGTNKILREIRIGTRSSPLSVAQTNIIAEEIMKIHPEIMITLVKIKTSGDKHLLPFSNNPNGIKGMFTLELEEALMNHEIDFAVHSLKDLPARINPSLPIIAYSNREDPRDALIMKREGTIATSSLRRKLQLERLYPDRKIVSVRGNVNSRIQKMVDNQYDGLVLAVSGLKRLGLQDRITKIFTIDEIMPAPGQGILVCQGRIDDDYGYLECVNDECSRDCAIAERSFSRSLNAGCNVPVGAYAVVHDDMLTLRGLYVDESTNRFYEGNITGRRCEAESLGERLSEVII